MDSPLNRAHQWGRKADNFMAAGNFEDAIMCHNRAAENMLETLQQPVLYDNANLVSCLCQQHQHHLRQVKVIQAKQLRHANMEAHKSRPVKVHCKAVQTETINSKPNRCKGIQHQNVLINTQDIEESIRDADTMLRYLKLRKDDPELQPPWGEIPLDHSDTAGGETTVVAIKKPKDDKMIIEELRCLTGELQEHIMQLVRESEWLKAENQSLTKQLGERTTQESQDASVHELIPLNTHFSNSSSFNLPPLEMPLVQQPPKLSSDSEDDLSDRF